MTNPLSKVVCIILVVILGVVVPVYNEYWLIDRMVFNQVNTITNDFQKQVRTKGYLTKNQYDNFIRKLNNTNRLYDVEILHRKITYYPENNNKKWSIQTFKYPKRYILDVIYNKNQDYKMNVGDDFSLIVQEKGVKGARGFFKHLCGKQSKSLIFATFGGMIENEDY